jgi:hypothetical protein
MFDVNITLPLTISHFPSFVFTDNAHTLLLGSQMRSDGLMNVAPVDGMPLSVGTSHFGTPGLEDVD